MTGQGRYELDVEGGRLTAEIRSVNHRGLKIQMRTSEALSRFEPKIEGTLRSQIKRGSVTVVVRWAREATALSPAKKSLIEAYARELLDLKAKLGVPTVTVDLTRLALSPELSGDTISDDADLIAWEDVEKVLSGALIDFSKMRQVEGQNMASALRQDLAKIAGAVDEIHPIVPQVIKAHAAKLESRIQEVLQKRGLSVESIDLIREVQLFVDRSDVSEEIVRLQSHIELFKTTMAILDGQAAVGRKLDFVIQEMLRETNTIGSKSSHAEISTHVVEIKCAIERMRELVQNLE
ncbi:MAG: YicC/YloC family endoribonuclease [Planctomycetota bacterium]